MKTYCMILAGLFVVGCGSEPPTLSADAGAGTDGSTSLDAGEGGSLTLDSITPNRGPHTGGVRALIRGAGFGDEMTVRVDGLTLPDAAFRALDDERLAVDMPPHAPGVVDIEVAGAGRTARLDDAFTYEPLAVEPRTGPTVGGNLIRVIGVGTSFASGDRVTLGGAPCARVEVVSETELSCRAPGGTEGAVRVEVLDGDSLRGAADDAYTYVATDRTLGGIGGGPIDGRLEVTVVGLGSGPLEGAHVIVGDDPSTTLQGTTDSEGRIVIESPDLVGPINLHIAQRCRERRTYIALDSNAVVAALTAADQTIPECMGVGSRPIGRGPGRGNMRGELVFYAGQEFASPAQGWVGVPPPRAGERRVAIVSSSQTTAIVIDGDSDVLPERVEISDAEYGDRGYPFAISGRSGTGLVFAIAGLMNEQDEFTPFILGFARPVTVMPDEDTIVEVPMTVPLSTQMTVGVSAIPGGAVSTPSPSALVTGPTELGFEGGYQFPDLSGIDALAWAQHPPPSSDEHRFSRLAINHPDMFRADLIIVGMWTTPSAPASTGRVLRAPIGAETAQFEDLLGVPTVTDPAYAGTIENRRVAWELAGPTPALQRIHVQSEDYRLWTFFAPGSIREATIPVLEGLDVWEAPGPGRYVIGVSAYDGGAISDPYTYIEPFFNVREMLWRGVERGSSNDSEGWIR